MTEGEGFSILPMRSVCVCVRACALARAQV